MIGNLVEHCSNKHNEIYIILKHIFRFEGYDYKDTSVDEYQYLLENFGKL